MGACELLLLLLQQGGWSVTRGEVILSRRAGREGEVESEKPSRPGRESKQETKQLEVDI